MSRYLDRVAKRLCGYCGKPTKGRACQKCINARKREKKGRYKKRREANLCVDCGKPVDGVRCESCAERLKLTLDRYKSQPGICQYGVCQTPTEAGRIYCQKHNDEASVRRDKLRKARLDAGLCTCGRERDSDKHIECSFCRASAHKSHKKCAAQTRQIVMSHYSGGEPRCACCGEATLLFLSIDHINGNGNIHRKEVSKGHGSHEFYRWLIRNGLPEGYQVLCRNCNYGKWANGGICPHKQLPQPGQCDTASHDKDCAS